MDQDLNMQGVELQKCQTPYLPLQPVETALAHCHWKLGHCILSYHVIIDYLEKSFFLPCSRQKWCTKQGSKGKFLPEHNNKGIKIVTIFQSSTWGSNGIHVLHIREHQGPAGPSEAGSRGGQELNTAGRPSASNRVQQNHQHSKQKAQSVTKNTRGRESVRDNTMYPYKGSIQHTRLTAGDTSAQEKTKLPKLSLNGAPETIAGWMSQVRQVRAIKAY